MSFDKTKLNIAVVDDHALFRSGLISLLSEIASFNVLLDCENGEEFVSHPDATSVDIVLMDLEMPKMNGMQMLEHLIQEGYKTKVIVISSHDQEKFIVHLMELGAAGYLLKNAQFEEVCNAIHSVNETGYYFNDLVSQVMLKGLMIKNRVKPTFKDVDALSEREIEVLKLICEENTTAEIADKLFISPRTVDGHRNHIMDKTGVRNTAGIVVFALKNNLVSL